MGNLQIAKPAACAGARLAYADQDRPGKHDPWADLAYTLNYQNKSSATSTATGVQLKDASADGAHLC